MAHQSNELLRKSIHILFGFGAFTLKWIPWWMAVAVAAMAVVGNWLILHKVVGSRVSRHERGWDAGIILYPAVILVLLVLFRNERAIPAICWGILAFGDGFATLAGKWVGGPRLPWNRDKSWSGFVTFFIAGLFAAIWLADWMDYGPFTAVTLAVLAAAIVESLPLGVDDNLTVPAAAATVLLYFIYSPFHPRELGLDWPWLAANTILAIAGYAMRSVNMSGAIGGWILGTIMIVCTGTPMYVALLVFFTLATAATKAGYRKKAAAGLAQEEGGRRGFSHAFANAGVATLCSVAFFRWSRTHWPVDAAMLVYLMGIGSLATAAADTVASEVGQLLGKRAFLPLTLRRVPTGTEGAISIEGTLAGALAGFIVALSACLTFHSMHGYSRSFLWYSTAIITVAAIAGSWLESVAGSWNRRAAKPVPNGVLNFFNTAAGAAITGVLLKASPMVLH